MPPWISRVLPGSRFPRSRGPLRFFSLRGFQSANSSLTRLPRLPAATRRPSSTPRITTSLPPTLRTPFRRSSASLPGTHQFLFSFSSAPGLIIIFPLLNAFGHHHSLSVWSGVACLGLPKGPPSGLSRNRVLLNGKLTGLWEPELLLVGRGSNTYFMQKYDNTFIKCI